MYIKKHILTLYALLVATFLPATASAKTLAEAIKDFIQRVLALLVPTLIALGVVLFLWGVLKYVTAGGDEKRRSDGIKVITWGIIALFVMVSLWGLINMIEGTFQLRGSNVPFPSI